MQTQASFSVWACLLLLLLVSPAAQPTQLPYQSAGCVILLHGLARTAESMEKLEQELQAAGYTVINHGYPSRSHTIDVLSESAINQGLADCQSVGAVPINFVTHSLGGILVRFYLSRHEIPAMGRVVMLAPPNQGSEVVDALAGFPGYDWLNGPAGQQLGTGAGSVPLALGPADFDVGVIAGNRSINLWLSRYLPNPDDGKVSVASTRLEGMRDFLVLPVSHPYIMKDDEAIRQVKHYLRFGRFIHTQDTSRAQ